MKQPSATRIQIARKTRKCTRGELGHILGVTAKTIEQWEDIEYRFPSPTGAQVKAIADALFWPVEFFYGDDVDLIPVEAMSL